MMKKNILFIIILLSMMQAKQYKNLGSMSKIFTEKIIKQFHRLKKPNKNNIAVFPLDVSKLKRQQQSVGSALNNYLISKLKATGEFDIIDKSSLDKVLKEIELGLTGLSSDKNPNTIGKLASAHIIITGNISFIGGNYIIGLKASLVETGKIMVSEVYTLASKQLNSLATLLYLKPKSPMVAGFRSILIPGWGQFYNDKKLTGTILFSTGITSLVSAGVFAYLINLEKTKGIESRKDYDNYYLE